VCGVVLLAGPRARDRIEVVTSRLRHRGPDDQTHWAAEHVALGFTRLEINGPGALGRQPYEHGESVGAFNGEIYNHQELASEHGLPRGLSDTRVILPLLARLGPRVIDVLDGFYAGVALDRSTDELLCLRDHMGKKPLFVGRSFGEVFVVSELKALDGVEWFAPLPLGASSVDLRTGRVRVLAEHRAHPLRGDLPRILRAAVHKRVPSPDQPVGVFLSGGLDSAIVSAFVARERTDATFFVLGNEDGPDRQAVSSLVAALQLANVREVPLPPPDALDGLLRAVVESTESFNPSIVSNGAATYLLARAARDAGIEVVLTGDGADELFGGYHDFAPGDPWNEMRQRLVEDMQSTELRRLDLCTMAHGVEARCPFLDREVRAHAAALGFEDLYADGENKVALRRAFVDVLPPDVLHRRKNSFDVGSGMRRMVVQHLRRHGRSERDELRLLWRERFTLDAANPYFGAYPAFDPAIDVRGETHR
jgi:asparagine synthase (glutamine-hydrolysing)